jgi:hypothetical protein
LGTETAATASSASCSFFFSSNSLAYDGNKALKGMASEGIAAADAALNHTAAVDNA